jgi:type IV secretion system protein VirB10
MAIDPGYDGVSPRTRRLPFTARQRVVVMLLILAVAMLAVALTGLIGKKPKPHDTAGLHGFSGGLPWTAPSEPKPIEKPIRPVAHEPTPIPKLVSVTPSADAALEASMFSTTGDSSNGTVANARRGGVGPREKDDEFTAAMTASGVGAPAKAHRMQHPSLTIPAGIVIPCTLQTAINSELMGFVDCTLPGEVRSADGTVTLMDKGTTVMGQIKSGLRRGQERLFILWVRARTPDNVTVNLASPAADELGRAGVTGYVNNHFARMFWNAALFSLIEYGPQLATSAIQNQNHGQNSVNNYTSFLSPQQSLANTILQEDLKIPPTLEKNQSDVVSIFVARDLDFSGVYDVASSRSISTCDACAVPTWTTQRDLERNR